MRRAALLGAGAVLALAAVAVSSAEPAVSDEEAAERTKGVEGAGHAAGTERTGGRQPMPDLLGRGLWRVFTVLAPRTRLDVHDVGGRDRRVLWPPNWWVCTQYPAPGVQRRARGRVVVGVVKKGETCPERVSAARR
ncbi:hypothetical protein [Streptomyces roseicoloratus]|uniref:Secreted protein n=1 Tax=Streptomyces roseicoloratus TaxID=2508722 RepID=A0ABY9RR93_9ACTN|nr:hypothetical protein [Streptomyces roseicoloratus]WMX44224.1 hypothetical protein RGF97_04245 [Streptomyces roseicoloratus]